MAGQGGNYCYWGGDIGLVSEFMSESTYSQLICYF